MMPTPDSFAQVAQAISLQSSGQKTNSALTKLSEAGYEIQLGLTQAYADQILKMSQEPSIREYCTKDSAERFRDRPATENWLKKGRAIFLLVKNDASKTLVGYGWAGPATSPQVPDGKSTFAVRLGEAGQGLGLATSFCWLIGVASAEVYGLKNFWLETWASNGAAVHIYHKLGFQDVAQIPSQRPRPDGQTVPDTRLYMSLSNEQLVQ